MPRKLRPRSLPTFRVAIPTRLWPTSLPGREVLAGLGRGWSNARLAEELFVSEKTVKTHVSAVLRKLGLDDRTQAALLRGQVGWWRLIRRTAPRSRDLGESGRGPMNAHPGGRSVC